MNKEFEYLTVTAILNDDAPLLIQTELNKYGREGYIVVGTSHWGGYQSPKKVMYTLMRRLQTDTPEPAAPTVEHRTAQSKANDIIQADESENISFEELLRQAEERFKNQPPVHPQDTEPEF